MRTLCLLAFGLIFSATSAQAYTCRDAGSPVEKAICGSVVLQSLDDEMNAIYDDAMANVPESGRLGLRDDQDEWIDARENCGNRARCIEQLYHDRIAELQDAGRDASRPRREVVDGEARWAALGTVEANDRFESLVIPVGFSKGRFDALQFRVRDSSVRLRSIVVEYGNGQRHRMRFRKTFRAGEISNLLELRPFGRGRFIARITLTARTAGYDRDWSRIEVAGRHLGRGAPRSGPFSREYGAETDRKYGRGDEYGRDDDPRAEYGRNTNPRAEYGRRDGGDYGRRDDDEERRNSYAPRDRAELDTGRDRDNEYDREPEPDTRYDPPNERAEPAPNLDKKMLGFIKNVFHRTASMTPSELRDTYANRVDYYGDKNKPVSEVIKDKEDYAERWPDRAFRVEDDTVEIKDTRTPDVYDVTYHYDFHVRGNGRESRGNGETTLRIDTRGDRYVILAENGKVLKRF